MNYRNRTISDERAPKAATRPEPLSDAQAAAINGGTDVSASCLFNCVVSGCGCSGQTCTCEGHVHQQGFGGGSGGN